MPHLRRLPWRCSRAALGLCLALAAPAKAETEAVAAVAKSIVQVRVSGAGHRVATGSATAVDPGVLITCCHGLKHARRIEILTPGKPPNVIGVLRDVERDLCALMVDAPVVPVTLASDEHAVRVGDYVAAVGSAGAEAPVRAAEGRVLALHPYDGGSVIQTDAAFPRGSSGGALVNADGELIGVLTFLTPGRSDAYFAVPVRWLRDLLARVKAGAPPEVQPKLSFWERDDQQRPAFLSAAARKYADDWDGLRELAVRWAEREPANPQAWIALGIAHFEAGQAPAAIAAFERAVALDMRLGTAWFYLGAAYRSNGQEQGVERAIERLDALDPAAARALRAGHTPE